jgi:phage-related protein
MEERRPPVKPLKWVGSSKERLEEFPDAVQKEMGYGLYLAQIGLKALKAKPLHGFGGGGVLEIAESHDGSAYRAVYTVQFAEVIFVLHVFQKKSKHGIKTPRSEMEIVKARLNSAREFHATNYRSRKS